MHTQLLLGFSVLLAAPPVAAPPAPPARPARPADAVVKVTASLRYPNPIRPWTQAKAVEVSGSGVIIEGNKILTNAHLVEYATEVHVQSGPGADKIEARVESVARELDLAVLALTDKTFFRTRPPLPRSAKLPSARDTVEVYGFPIGGEEMSVTKGVISRIGYGPYFPGVVLQVSAAINHGNSGGPAVVAGKMVGVVFSRLSDAENIGFVIPNEEIDFFLASVKSGRYTGKPRDATFTQYQRLENESLRGLLKLDRRTKGIVVFPRRPSQASNPFLEFDVLTRIGGHNIDNDGMVRLPSGLRIPFFGVIPLVARANAVEVTVLRQGKLLRLSMPVTTANDRLVPGFRGEHPSYFIHGPLVFSPARDEAISEYFRLNPNLSTSRSLLLGRRYDRMSFPGEELVVVTTPMFDHKIAKGYDDPLGQVLAEVNGQKVKNLRHLVEILRDSSDEHLKFRFADEGSEILVFRRTEMNRATNEILEEAGIAPSRRASRDMLAVWNKRAAAPR
jgi:S1-C subfamily serine protease